MKKLLLMLFSIFLLSSCSSLETSINNEEIIENGDTGGTDPNEPSEPEADELPELNSNVRTTLNSYIKSLVDRTPSYIPAWNQEGFKGRWNYIDGVFLKSIIKLENNNYKYIDFVKQYVDYYVDSNGNFVYLNEEQNPGGAAYNSGELDSVCESKILFDLYKYTNDQRYLNAINYTYEQLLTIPKLSDGICYSHKVSYPNQVWLDGFYMYAPFLVRYANEISNNKQAIYKEIYDQYKFVRSHMYDENKKLYYHGYSETDIFWANSNKCSSSFWLRSMGWFITSLADVLEYYPSGTYKNELISLYKEAVDGILTYLDTDYNMFYQVIDKKGQSANVSYNKYLQYLNSKTYSKDAVIANYLESSGSSLIAYSLLKGYNLNILDSNYYKQGFDIFMGVYNRSFKNNKLNDICITAGLGPSDKTYRDGSFEYYLAERVGEDDAKGVGPFIMAFSEINK